MRIYPAEWERRYTGFLKQASRSRIGSKIAASKNYAKIMLMMFLKMRNE
jgi:hypothetical protein